MGPGRGPGPMSVPALVGVVLVLVGALDFLVGYLLIIPRVASGSTRTILRLAFALGGILMILLGAAFLLGIIPMGE